MKNILIALLVGVSFSFVSCIQIDKTKIQKKNVLDQKTQIEGVHNLDEALKSAKELNKNILIIFWAEWCPPCKRMERETLSAPAVKEAMKNYVFLHVNVDTEHSADKYKAGAIPRSVIIDKDGNVKNVEVGFLNRVEMLKFLKM